MTALLPRFEDSIKRCFDGPESVHGANGYSNDYPVERYWRNCKAAIIYEGTRDIHTLMQADWALGLKKEKPARKTLPRWPAAASHGASSGD